METLIGTSLGGYTLVRLLGSGGMGTVYLAEDASIGQQVAIKIVHSDASDFPEAGAPMRIIERFKQEARAVASLDHLHILPLYRYAEEETVLGPRAYIVMQYRPEGSLWDWLRRRASLAGGHPARAMFSSSSSPVPMLPAGLPDNWPLSLAEAGEYLQQAASALQYAHDRGIVHRDIKPANFLLRIDQGRVVHLLLSDFGLAKFFSSNSSTSTILGTPIYMAPEQFEGVAVPESDQYALAVMIYQFLAGHAPFEGDPLRLMHQHSGAVPPPIRTFAPELPAAIERVLARALAKKPAQRYPSISAFAEEFAMGNSALQRRPGLAFYPPGQIAGAGVPQVAAVSPLQPAINTAAPTPLYPEDRGGQAQALAAYVPPSLPPSLSATLQSPSVATTPTVPASPGGGVPIDPALPAGKKGISRRRALAWVLGGTIGGIAALAGGTGIYFYIQARKPEHALHVLRGHSDAVTSISWSPGGSLLVSGARDNTARLWRVASEQNTLTYRGHQGPLLAVAWHPNGALLASAGRDKTVQIWNTTGAQQRAPFSLAAVPAALAWWPAGSGLFIGTLGEGVRELALSADHAAGKAGKSNVHAIALSPDERYLATALASGSIILTDLAAQPRRNTLYSGHRGAVLGLAWSPDSSMLASAGTDATARIWAVSTGQLIHTLTHQATVTGVSWDPSGRAYLASGSVDKQVSVWNIDNNSRRVYSGHQGAVSAVAWGSDGLASASADREIIIWQA